MDAAVVIVNYNAGHHLADCVESLLRECAASVSQVIVVDNASVDGSVDLMAARWPDVVVIRNHDNAGLASANNQGIAASTADVIVICNPDVEFDDDAVAALVDCLERHPRAAVAGSQTLTPEGKRRVSAGDLPRWREAWLGRARSGRFWWVDWDHGAEVRAGHVLEDCYAVRRSAIAEVGAQDPGYFVNWEGVDWCARFIEAGWEVWFCPTARKVHHGGVSVNQVHWRWEVWTHSSMRRYFTRHSRIPGPLLLVLALARLPFKALWVGVAGFDSLPPVISADRNDRSTRLPGNASPS